MHKNNLFQLSHDESDNYSDGGCCSLYWALLGSSQCFDDGDAIATQNNCKHQSSSQAQAQTKEEEVTKKKKKGVNSSQNLR